MTDHVKDQLCARIEELEKEKLELNEQLDVAQREREVLSAHVEFCHKVLSMIENGPDYLVAKQYRALRLARERKPETSLARLKAQWQAVALDSLESRIKPLRQTDNGAQGKGYNLALEDCLAAIDMVRRQAEGSEV